MSAIRIRVGAAVDASVAQTFENVKAVAARAAKMVNADLKAAGKGAASHR